MLGPTAHVDTFARDRLPPPDQWPDFRLEGLDYPEHLKPRSNSPIAWSKAASATAPRSSAWPRRTYKELADWKRRRALWKITA